MPIQLYIVYHNKINDKAIALKCQYQLCVCVCVCVCDWGLNSGPCVVLQPFKICNFGYKLGLVRNSSTHASCVSRMAGFHYHT
jgi:hypothetical protein